MSHTRLYGRVTMDLMAWLGTARTGHSDRVNGTVRPADTARLEAFACRTSKSRIQSM